MTLFDYHWDKIGWKGFEEMCVYLAECVMPVRRFEILRRCWCSSPTAYTVCRFAGEEHRAKAENSGVYFRRPHEGKTTYTVCKIAGDEHLQRRKLFA